MRAVIYARYSTDLQSKASLADQVRLCRRHAEQQRWDVVKVYEDAALSGASTQRPAYRQLLHDAASGCFDLVLAESLDRLSRRLADTAQLFDELTFHRVKLFTLHQGEITQIHVGMLGTVAQIYLSDLRDKTRRGLSGRIAQGRSAGGLAYGYRAVPGEVGARRIEEAEAAVVRRIFRQSAAGTSPRTLARTLNLEGVPGPGGRTWSDSTIRGQAARGTGILNNDLYVGRLVWNRCSYVKDPRTGKRMARPNPPDLWESEDVPELRIVEDALWQAVKARQEATRYAMRRDESGNALNRAHRRHFLLSGLLECARCGGAYTIVATDRYGCTTHRAKGSCPNDRTVRRQEIEARVLDGLKERLLTPDLLAEFVAEYHREQSRLLSERDATQREAQRRLSVVTGRIERIVDAVSEGHATGSMLERLHALEAEKEQLTQHLADESPGTVQLHPNLPELYRRKIATLTSSLENAEIREEAAETLRRLIDKVVITPRAGRGIEAVLHGDLAQLLAVCAAARPDGKRPSGGVRAEGLLSVVAGVGFEPTTFRL